VHLKVLCCCLLALVLGISDIDTAAAQDVRLSEVHYDNTGTDSGEAIEISGPADSNVAGWQVVLYNGNGGVTYDTRVLSGTIPATCGTRGVLVLNYPANGIQNGGAGATDTTSPDAIALVDGSGTVVEFISYEGVVAATNGPAVGLVSTDIGVRELGTEALGQSLWRNADGLWSGPAANTFGTCNDDGDPNPPAEVVSVTVAPTTATVTVGGTVTFTASAFDVDGDPVEGVAFTWTSSAPSIATVNASGVATAVAAGDVVITATAPNGIANTAALHVDTAPPTGTPDIRFSEIHYDNAGADVGESIEIEGPAGASVAGFSVVLYNGNGGAMYSTSSLSGTIPATCNARGVVVVTYPQDGLQNGSPDGFALVDAGGQLVEFLSYEGTFTASNGPAAGVTSTDIVATQNSAPAAQSLQRNSSNAWQSAAASFGACNGEGDPGPIGNTISFTGRTPSEPALPVGFQDQLFATVRNSSNVVVPTTITWMSETPAIASIDSAGVMTALAAGTAIVRATAADGVTTATYSLPTRIAVASTTAEYAGNAEFGEPQDADPSDDFIVRYPQYVASYNPNRGTPNWLSYNIDATHFGAEDRCDCFTADPALPSTFTRLTTNDYTGAGAFHGYGIDRGHMARSFDRTTASLDNAVTYYFTNIVPQAADLNQGPWSDLEFVLGDFARFQDKEVYIIAGVAGNKGTIKNEGKIVIPTSTWKVAVIMPRNRGLANIADYRDVQVVAVNMPNDPGVRDVAWETYQTTVDAIELLSGYDLLALLPDDVESAVESGTQPPIGNVTGPSSAAEGNTVAFSAAASIDPNGSVVSYEWSFGDGATGTGVDAAHTFTQDGVYAVSVTITDNDGLTDTVTTTITVANVAPIIGDFPGATLNVGDTYTVSGSFTDPGAETWTATLNWGDGSAASTATLSSRNFSLTHAYTSPGTFTVTVSIADDDSTTSRTQTVVVTPSAAQPLAQAKALVDQLVATRKISNLVGAVLKAQLIVAEQQLARGNDRLAIVALRAVIVQIDALVLLTPLTPADVAGLRTAILNVIALAR
jgi:DNA/RNA endonuclease G (NUC1)/PKD repeat protein